MVNEQVSACQPKIFTQPLELMTSKLVDLVVITAPNHVHFGLAKDSLQNNLHVVVEKPMTLTLAEAQELAALATKKKLLLSVFHNRRWDSDFLTVKKLLATKALGKVKVFHSHFNRFRPQVANKWKEQKGCGSGVWYDLGPHLIDQTLILFGLPLSLTANCLMLRENAAATDYFNVQLNYENMHVILSSSPFVVSNSPRFNIQGTEGQFIKQGKDPQEQQLRDGILPSTVGFGHENTNQFGILLNQTQQQVIASEVGNYGYYYQQLARAINQQYSLPVPITEALSVMKILELAILSSEQGRTINV
jgi:predicted dehydrogenase